jgi:hypothetical protein
MSVVAGLVIETAGGAAPRVAARLLHATGLQIQGGDGLEARSAGAVESARRCSLTKANGLVYGSAVSVMSSI